MEPHTSEHPNLGDDELISNFLKRQKQYKQKSKVSGAPSSKPKTRRIKKRAKRPTDYDQGPNQKYVYDILYRHVDNRFWNKNCADRFEFINNREIICERQINFAKHRHIQFFVENLLRQAGLLKTIQYPKTYFPELVKEFYANLNDGMFDKEDELVFGRVFVRGKTLDFTPELINNFVGSYNVPYDPVIDVKNIDFRAVSLNLTGKELSLDGTTVKASNLTLSASVLHKIAKVNWVPTKQTSILYRDLAVLIYKVKGKRVINFGELVFSLIKEHNSKNFVSSLLPFPCLICGIILSQVEPLSSPLEPHPILRINEKSVKYPPAIYISAKLLKEGHMNDIGSEKGKEKEAGPSVVKDTGIINFLIKQLDDISAKRDDLDREEMEINKLLQTLPVEDESDDSENNSIFSASNSFCSANPLDMEDNVSSQGASNS